MVLLCYLQQVNNLDTSSTHGFFHYQASVLFAPADIAVYCLEYSAI